MLAPFTRALPAPCARLEVLRVLRAKLTQRLSSRHLVRILCTALTQHPELVSQLPASRLVCSVLNARAYFVLDRCLL